MNKLIERISFGKIKDRSELPNFLEYQLSSFENFVQLSKDDDKRENKGLENIFRDFFPIVSSYGNLKLEYGGYRLEESEFPLNNELECTKRSKTFSKSLKIKLKILDNEDKKIQEDWVYVCDMPFMTSKGTFIINGAERVVVSQLHRSPGVFFSKEFNMQSGLDLFSVKIIPLKGTWLEIETTKDETMQVRIDRKKKVSFPMFVKALGFWKNNHDIAKSFFKKKKLSGKSLDWSSDEVREELIGSITNNDLIDENSGEIIFDKGTFIDVVVFDKYKEYNLDSIEYFYVTSDREVLANSLKIDLTKDKQEAIMDLFKKLRASDIATTEGAKSFVKKTFFSVDRYDLSGVGRYKINSRLNLDKAEDERLLTKEDIVSIVNYLLDLQNDEGRIDDIDSLSNRRVRGVGELLGAQIKIGLAKIERSAKEKMSMSDPYTITPKSILNTKFLYSVIMDFFATGQLSQFMDQSNPLSELTHKRRISSLGPGGLTRDKATFDVRDVHNSHYGRICPVETPEGPNIGLMSSISTFARINKYGFIETPYAKVENGKVTKTIDYLTYDEETKYFIAQIDTPVDKNDNITSEDALCRFGMEDRISIFSKEKVNYIDVSPKQLISVSSSLIPFLEHTDANRALTGSNMQRQAVPLITTEAPHIGTGMERKVAVDSGAMILAKKAGKVVYVDADKIIIKEVKGETVYELMNFVRSNHAMSMTHKPLVNKGDVVSEGDVIADGPSTDRGDLSLGKNIRVAFMPFQGYNFEDSILISERLVKDEVFTSIHIEEYDIEVRATKLGDEEITRELPNVSEDAIKDLDEEGVVRVGAEVSSGSILVGKITPKGETDPPAEEKLLRAIFGEKARDVRDTSLRLSHGAKGVVVDVIELDRNRGDDLPAGVNKIVKIYIAEKRKITVGDKMCGRHGNKGIVSRILPVEDMPFLPDGRAVDVVLNPLGVPSRMNIGQILETHLGLAASELGLHISTPVFDGAKEEEIVSYLNKAGYDGDGKTVLYDGRTGEAFDHRITVGCIYMLKLHHLVEDKMHVRAIGPYSLVTQQPLGGKAQFGGQRLGEMEVWALEAYGVSNVLREMLTIKSDDILGRTKTYEAIVKGSPMPEPAYPESFKVLIREFNSLGLNVDIYNENDEKIVIDGDRRSNNTQQEFSLSYLNDEENS